jgi:thymidine kinase
MQSYEMHGKLEIIMGCMFSGKTSTLLTVIEKHKRANLNVLVINHSSDTRYTTASTLCTHDKQCVSCVMLDDLSNVYDLPCYSSCHIILIDEGQFFINLRRHVLRLVEEDCKHVIVAGLDGDYKREGFKEMLDIIPLADEIIKLKAYCVRCKDGTPAIFSKRRGNSQHDSNVLVGGVNEYEALCRQHFLAECS